MRKYYIILSLQTLTNIFLLCRFRRSLETIRTIPRMEEQEFLGPDYPSGPGWDTITTSTKLARYHHRSPSTSSSRSSSSTIVLPLSHRVSVAPAAVWAADWPPWPRCTHRNLRISSWAAVAPPLRPRSRPAH